MAVSAFGVLPDAACSPRRVAFLPLHVSLEEAPSHMRGKGAASISPFLINAAAHDTSICK